MAGAVLLMPVLIFANMLLRQRRHVAFRKEIAVRLAVGASRWRIRAVQLSAKDCCSRFGGGAVGSRLSTVQRFALQQLQGLLSSVNSPSSSNCDQTLRSFHDILFCSRNDALQPRPALKRPKADLVNDLNSSGRTSAHFGRLQPLLRAAATFRHGRRFGALLMLSSPLDYFAAHSSRRAFIRDLICGRRSDRGISTFTLIKKERWNRAMIFAITERARAGCPASPPPDRHDAAIFRFHECTSVIRMKDAMLTKLPSSSGKVSSPVLHSIIATRRPFFLFGLG